MKIDLPLIAHIKGAIAEHMTLLGKLATRLSSDGYCMEDVYKAYATVLGMTAGEIAAVMLEDDVSRDGFFCVIAEASVYTLEMMEKNEATKECH